MNSRGDKKRKSGTDETGSSRYAKRLTCKAPPAQGRQQPGFLDLPAGVIAKVGQFLHIGTYHGRNAMADFCVVVGPKVAKVVRQEYLENNLDYLMFVLRCEEDLALFIEYGVEDDNLNVEKTESRIFMLSYLIQEWMRWNAWWKQAALSVFDDSQPATTINAKSEPPFPNLFETVEVRKNSSFRLEPTCNSILVDIDGIRGKAAKSTNKMPLQKYEEETEMETVRLIHKGFYKIFFNPALSIDVGLMDLLKFQVEELKLDVNSKSFTAIFEKLLGDEDWIPLLFHAFLQPDSSFFDFLWSQKELDVNPIIYENYAFLHWISEPFRASSMDGWDWHTRRVEHILKRVPDTNARDDEGRTPLDSICIAFTARDGTCPHLIDIAMLYISHGIKASGYRLHDMRALQKNIRDNNFGIREKLKKENTLEFAELHINQMLYLITESIEGA